MKRRGAVWVAGALALVALALLVTGCPAKPGIDDDMMPAGAGGLTNLDRLQLEATAAATNQPIFKIDNTSAGAESLVVEDAGTRVYVIGNDGSQTGNTSLTGAWKVVGPTAATTATPVARINNAADVNDLLVVEKDATPVFVIGNAGAITHTGAQSLTGDQSITGAWAAVGPTAAVTATPVVRIGNAADVNDLLVIEKDATPVFIIGNAGAIDAEGAADIADTLTLSKGSGNALVVSAGGAAQFNGAVSLTLANGAGAGANPWDYTATLGAMDGSDTFELFDINLTGANHAGTGNVISGMNFGLTSPDAQVLEQAIVIDDTDWDVAINTGDVPIFSRAMVWFEDFFGDAIPDEIEAVTGTDPQAVAVAIEADQAGGVATFSTGDDNAGGCAASCAGAVLGLHWSANTGGTLIFETRIHLDGDITNKMLAVGFIDNAALEFPVTIGGSDARSWTSDDAVVFVYDSGADTDEWFALSRAGTTEGTGVGATGVAPVGDTFQTLRIEVDQGGADARFYIDGVLVATVTANAVTAADLLSPIVIADTSEDAVQAVDVDYIAVWGQR